MYRNGDDEVGVIVVGCAKIGVLSGSFRRRRRSLESSENDGRNVIFGRRRKDES